MKNWSIKFKIMIPLLIIMVAGITSQAILIAVVSSNATRDLSYQLATQGTERYAQEFETIGSEILGAVTSIAPVIDSFAQDANGRERAVNALEKILLSNNSFLGVWTCWEPNAYDGRDEEYIDAPYHDSTGRFVPYVYRDTDKVGYAALSDYDSSEYYLGAKKTQKTYVSDPYEYSVGGIVKLMCSMAVPIVENGVTLGVVGVDISLDNIASVLNAGKILDTGYVFSLSPSGYFASHPDSKFVMKSYSDYWMNDHSSEINKVLTQGGSFEVIGSSDVLSEDVIFTGVSVSFDKTDRKWMVGSIVPMSAVNKASVSLVQLIIIAGIILTASVVIVVFLIIRVNLRDLPVLSEIAETLSKGSVEADLGKVPEGNTRNEIVLLKRSFNNLMDTIKAQVESVRLIAKGDYSFDITPRSDNDSLNIALKNMLESSNNVFLDINRASEQVSSGSEQVAQGAQELAAGSSEQAASIDEFSSALTSFEKKTVQNADNSRMAQEANRKVDELIGKGTQSMKEMLNAMGKIDESSQSITRIIKVIDDIAFQTNILALNAAVEAARAGQHGKGFAVVADEVRNLAGKSAAAAKETAELIDGSSQKVSEGNRLVEQTNNYLKAVSENARQSMSLVDEVTAASSEQANSIHEMAQAMNQISSVIQSNSAMSEQSAAAAEQMSSQSKVLSGIVSEFKLKK